MVYIEHNEHKIMFDTAGPAKRVDMKKRLAELNIDPHGITDLVISHFHYDHVYNYDHFPNADIFMHKLEYEWLEKEPCHYAIPPHFFQAIKCSEKLKLIDRDTEIIDGVEAISVPGHTPGSMALVLRDTSIPTTVIAGDAVKNMAELATGHVPNSLDQTLASRSIKKIRDIAEIVIPGHDRILQVTDNRISSLSELNEEIIIPTGVVYSDKDTRIQLSVRNSWLPKIDII